MPNTIICPECRTQIEVTEALAAQVRSELSKEFEARQRTKEAELAARENTLAATAKRLEQDSHNLEERLQQRLDQERLALETKARDKAKAEFAAQITLQSDELSETRAKLADAQKAELELLKQKRDLENQKNELELRVAREIDRERAKIRDEAQKEISDERALKDAENAKLIADLTRQIGDLKRKAEQGSQQSQGEVMELELESLLPREFPSDQIAPIAKGVRGADVLQTVLDTRGDDCGKILWESKNAKNWGADWIEKLRNDQREAKARFAILVSTELPKGITHFGNLEGIWVSSWSCAVPLASALRASLIEIALASRALEGQHGKMEQVYHYLSGNDFRQRVDGIVRAFVSMEQDLEAEKRAQTKLWAKREKQLALAANQTCAMYGDLQGIIGASLPAIPLIDWPAIEEEASDGPSGVQVDSGRQRISEIEELTTRSKSLK